VAIIRRRPLETAAHGSYKQLDESNGGHRKDRMPGFRHLRGISVAFNVATGPEELQSAKRKSAKRLHPEPLVYHTYL
jgi:hypothetical protein